MAATRTTLTRGVMIALTMAMASWTGMAQSTMPEMVAKRVIKDADKDASLSRFAEAYDRYRSVAMSDHNRAKKDSSFTPRMEVFEKGIDCAMRAGLVLEATELLDTLIAGERATPEQLMMRLELALHQGDNGKVSSIASNPSLAKDPAWAKQVSELMARSTEAKSKETRAEISRARPSSDVPEFGAVLYKEGLVFVTTAVAEGMAAPKDGWTGRQFTELRQVALKDSADNPVSVGEMASKSDLSDLGSSAFHNGPVAFSADETRAYVTRSQEEARPDTSGKLIYNLQLEVLEASGTDSWNVVEGGFPYNDSTYSTAHAALDTTGNLIFSSNRPGGQGGMDLWMCKKGSNGMFEAPQNLGPAVNTAGNEVFPFVNSVNQLYYSTDGRIGLGGLDLYKYDMASGESELLGSPVNSAADDFALHVDATGLGYMSSNRESGMDRIFNIQLIDIYADFEIQVVTCDDASAAGAEMDLHNLTTGEKSTLRIDAKGMVTFRTVVGETAELSFEGDDVFAGMGTKSYMSDEEGTFKDDVVLDYAQGENTLTVSLDNGKTVEEEISVTMMAGGASVTLTTDTDGILKWPSDAVYESFRIDYPGYAPYEAELTNDNNCPKPQDLTVHLVRMVEIDLSLVLFNWDKFDLRGEGKNVLDEVITYMKEVDDVRVELSAHTDSHGSNEYNLDLSQRRAQSCVDYLIAGGISKDRLVATGYGEERLKNRCVDGVYCTKIEHQENRRVELKILPR